LSLFFDCHVSTVTTGAMVEVRPVMTKGLVLPAGFPGSPDATVQIDSPAVEISQAVKLSSPPDNSAMENRT
jgi:hypothetical protein